MCYSMSVFGTSTISIMKDVLFNECLWNIYNRIKIDGRSIYIVAHGIWSSHKGASSV